MTVGSTSIKVKLKDIEEEKGAIVPNTQAFIELIQEKNFTGKCNRVNSKNNKTCFIQLSIPIFTIANNNTLTSVICGSI